MTTRRSHLHPATGVALTAALGAASGWTNTVTHLLDVLLCWYVKRLERQMAQLDPRGTPTCS